MTETISIAALVAILAQLVGVIFYFGALTNRLKTLEQMHSRPDDTSVRLSAIETKLILLIPEIERLRTRLDRFLDKHELTQREVDD